MKALLALLRALVLLAVLGPACAAGYPDHAIKIVVPWPPGGAVDILARPIADRLSRLLHQPVFIDNRPGANGIIGANDVAHANPDGYTLLIENLTGQAINVTLYKSLPFNLFTDLEPVGLIASVANTLVVAPSAPVASVHDIIQLAKAKPNGLAYASFGIGSTAHLAGEMFDSMAGVKMVHVPYKGGPPALTDVMAGRVFMMFATAPSVAALIKSGKLKAIATTGAERSEQAPELPTMAESGLPGFEATTLYGAMFPAHTPHEIVQRMSDALREIAHEPQLARQFSQLGFHLKASSPEQLSKILKEETSRWGPVVKQSGATAQ